MSNLLASPWVPTFLFGLLVTMTRCQQRSWVAPSVFAPAIWLIYLLVPLTAAPEYRVSALSMWLLLVLIGGMSCGAMIAEGGSRDSLVPLAPLSKVSVPVLLRWTVALSAVSLAGALDAAGTALNDYGLTLSFSSFLDVGHLLAVERYSGEQSPALVRLLTTWMYPAALLGGITSALPITRRQRALCFVPLLPALAFSLVQAARANTLIAVALGGGGWLAAKVCLGQQHFRVAGRRSLLAVALAVLTAVSFFLVIDLFRIHKPDQQLTAEMDFDWGRVQAATVGYLATFGDWVERPEGLGTFQISLGAYSFGGLLEALGLHARKTGMYEELVILDQKGNNSNIYTAFRGLIEDFSLPGALLFCTLAGYLAGFCYRTGSWGRPASLVTLAAFYAFVVWSPIGSIFVYNGPILALLVAGLGMAACDGAQLRARGREPSPVKNA